MILFVMKKVSTFYWELTFSRSSLGRGPLLLKTAQPFDSSLQPYTRS